MKIQSRFPHEPLDRTLIGDHIGPHWMSSAVKRPDLAIPYVHKPDKSASANLAMVTKSLPLAALFMKSKVLSWASLIMAVHAYLDQTGPDSEGVFGTSISTAALGLGLAYMDFIYAPHRPTPASAPAPAPTS